MISMAEGEKSDEEVSQLFMDRVDCFFLWGKIRSYMDSVFVDLSSCIGRHPNGIRIERVERNEICGEIVNNR
jgi:hypothetical protein